MYNAKKMMAVCNVLLNLPFRVFKQSLFLIFFALRIIFADKIALYVKTFS